MCESIEQNKGRVVDWDCIQWDIPRRHVRRLQERIFRVTRYKDWAKVKNLQKLLVRSHSARLLAVRRITQENKGKNTPGITTSTAAKPLLYQVSRSYNFGKIFGFRRFSIRDLGRRFDKIDHLLQSSRSFRSVR